MKFKELFFGKSLNPFDPQAFRHIALIAFFAWIGLGADGLSSACYGPEEAFLALGENTYLALFVAFATALTVFIISLGYNQVIELFPSGGGGYKVATQLLGKYAGLVAGGALIVDYILTIAISTASGIDALFSLLPIKFLHYKLLVELLTVCFLMYLNIRGMKESIIVLLPIFVGFIVLHGILIVYGIIAHRFNFIQVVDSTVTQTYSLASVIGWFAVLGLILHSYTLGSGTYTGIEAVSNNVHHLAEPRIRTGKLTMLYMAISLAFTAAGIILLYLLWDAKAVTGQTLNAVVFGKILGDSYAGHLLLIATLLFESGILLVAANTGFLGGPAVLANMALDCWVPNRFRHLSSRLVTQNGVILFGVGALLILLLSQGKVSWLVILYSINVFITFSLALLGLCVYWTKHQHEADKNWRGRFVLSALGFVIASSILIVTLLVKFTEGAWVTVIITSIVIGVCLLIKKHYGRIGLKLENLNTLLAPPLKYKATPEKIPLDPQKPTAVFFIADNRAVGMHTLLWVLRMFPDHFYNLIFISVGVVDIQSFSGERSLNYMKYKVEANLNYFVNYCTQHDLAATKYSAYGTDLIGKLTELIEKVSAKYSNCIYFASQLSFEKDTWWLRILHNETPMTLQRYLHTEGKQLVILPMKI
jgi:amino acid transporter